MRRSGGCSVSLLGSCNRNGGFAPRNLASSASRANYDDFEKERAAKEKGLTNLQRRRVRRTLQPV
jgi:hypothetical protein